MSDFVGRSPDWGAVQVLIADSQLAFAQIVAARLDEVADINAVGIANIGRVIEDVLSTSTVDVLVIGVDLDGEDWAEQVAGARRRAPDMRIVVLVCEDDDPRRAVEALAAGATCLVSKVASFDELLATVHSAARAETRISPPLLTGIVDELLRRLAANGPHSAVSQLTKREREVLGCLESGMNRAAIARSLFLSGHTVRTHVGNLRSKLGAHTTLEAVAIAREAGIEGGSIAGSQPAGSGLLAVRPAVNS